MPHFEEPTEAPYQTTQENRPPQLNPRVCGCKCGSGVSGAFEGVGGEGSGNEDGVMSQSFVTLVNSDDDSATMYSENSEESFDSLAVHHSTHDDSSAPEVPTRFGAYVNTADGFALSRNMRGIEDQPMGMQRVNLPLRERDGVGGSLINDAHDSDDHSIAGSGSRMILRCMSPGPGLGSWQEDGLVDGRVNGYHFRDPPLRLTPQFRYCRGLSHLVWEDGVAQFTDPSGRFHDDGAGFH